jgi:hypothetical protein
MDQDDVAEATEEALRRRRHPSVPGERNRIVPYYPIGERE